MIKICVLESNEEGLAKCLCSRAAKYGATVAPVTSAPCDILVIAPGAVDMKPACQSTLKCRFLLTPEKAPAEFADAGCIVTYGMSGRSTLTISSIRGGEDMIAVQREVPTVTGHIIERQEISVSGGGEPERILALEGTMLLLGAYK